MANSRSYRDFPRLPDCFKDPALRVRRGAKFRGRMSDFAPPEDCNLAVQRSVREASSWNHNPSNASSPRTGRTALSR